ncbi:MAG: Ig-like domain-containing protein [Gemmatimonadetes bacterium]|nr:Ig-like domain-containing protein [Gemmatimonadota bacterium]
MTRCVPVLATAIALASSACDQTAPQVPQTMVVSPSHVTVEETGDTIAYRAQVLDVDGAIIYEADIAWSSSDERVATVSPRGVVTATGPGSVEIVATHGPVSGSGLFEVRLVPASLTAVAGDSQTAPALSSLPEDPSVRVEDADGVPIPDIAVTFRIVAGDGTVDPEQAVSDATGVASTRWTLGLAQGEQRLDVRFGTLTAEFAAIATEPELAIITQNLGRARAALGYRAALDVIGIRDEPLAWSITAGSLPTGVRLDSAGVLTGIPESAGTASFTATVRDAAERESSKALTLLVCAPPLQLQPGNVLVLGPDDFGECPPLLPSGEDGDLYRVAALRANTSPLAVPMISVRATAIGAGTVASGPAQRSYAADGATGMAALPPGLAAGVRIAEATARFHGELLEEAQALIRRTGRDALLPDNRTGPLAAASGATGQATPPQRIMLRPYAGTTGCNLPGPSPVAALLVGYNGHLAIYQDSVQRETAPVRTQDAQQVLDYYADYGAETIDEYFGGISDINGDDRVNVFVSPVIGEQVAGFVWPGDFLSRDACARSNQMELVYMSETQLRALGSEQENTYYQALPTIVHEMKHISSLYRRTAAGSFHPTWIEEGTAEIAAERSSRKAMQAAGGLAQEALLTRDDYPPRDGSIISPENYGVLTVLARTTLAYTAYNNSLVMDPAPGHSFYGSSWHFHRFLGDAYGDASERADGDFFTALNDTTATAGTAGMEEITGQSISALILEYATAMMLNGTGVQQPQRTFHTYDFPSATHQLFRPDFQPDGLYPWPRTGGAPAPFRSGTWIGGLAPAGIRFYDFRSDGTGDGIEIEVLSTGNLPGLRVAFTRLR